MVDVEDFLSSGENFELKFHSRRSEILPYKFVISYLEMEISNCSRFIETRYVKTFDILLKLPI